LRASHTIVSNASCTTNCLAPMAKVLQEHVGIEYGLMNTIHAVTNDQVLADVRHSDLRRARAATHSIIPTKTGAAEAVGLVIPELSGRLDGFALRVPVLNVSVVDLTFQPKKTVHAEDINGWMKEASQGSLKGILGYNDEPLVSIDFNHCGFSSVYDATQTKVLGSLVKVLAWYDNEWAFSNRMLDTAVAMMEAK
jgi:glyceraldehyde 3-phosphate dehydrogenase